MAVRKVVFVDDIKAKFKLHPTMLKTGVHDNNCSPYTLFETGGEL